jgi:hypothetical protein
VAGAPSTKVEVKNAATVNDTVPAVDSDIPAPVRAQATTDAALTDKDLAKSYRSQADAMYKEAARLRKEADELDPPQKKTTKKVEESANA